MIVGVDTHKHVHVAVAIDTRGIRLGDHSFVADSSGYQALLRWAHTHGRIETFGIEGTGSYGAGLGRCCTNRDWPARCQSTGSSPVDAIRHWSTESGHPIEDLTAEDNLTPQLASALPGGPPAGGWSDSGGDSGHWRHPWPCACLLGAGWGGFGLGGGIARRGPAVALTWGGAGARRSTADHRIIGR